MKIQVNSDILAQEVDDKLVLLNVGSEEYLSLNAVGALIWSELKNTDDSEKILSRITEEFDVEEAEARKDLEDFVKIMQVHHLVEIA